MLANKKRCVNIDISRREQEINQGIYDFDNLIPPVENDAEIEKAYEYAQTKKITQGMDVLPLDLYNSMLDSCLSRRDFRSAFFITAMVNFGLRHSDIVRLRRADFFDIYEDGSSKLKDSIVIWEKKTRKQRVVFVNQAIKQALLMLLWNSNIGWMDYLITSVGNNKGYEVETYIDKYGKKHTLRERGKTVYKLDENGNKIPKPLSRQASENILKDIIVKHLGISLKNDSRCNDTESALKIATHSLRKLYGWGITQDFINNFDADNAYAHTAALRFLSQDYGHSAEAITLRYSKDFDELKKSIVMRMNLGLNVIQNYYNEEAINYLANMSIN